MRITQKKLLATFFSAALVFGNVPAPAMAEIADEINAQESTLNQTVENVCGALPGESDVERMAALWDLMAAVSVQEAAENEEQNVDEQALKALLEQASTAAGVARVLFLVAQNLGFECGEALGSEGQPVVEVTLDGTTWQLDAAAGTPGAYPWDGAGEVEPVAEDGESAEELPAAQPTEEDAASLEAEVAEEVAAEEDASSVEEEGLAAQGASETSLSTASVKIENQLYTGKALTPTATVTLGDETLTANTDYTMSYKNNVAAGTAEATITGKGSYTGSKTAKFKIVRPDVSYAVHVQTYGDQSTRKNGAMAGTSGKSKRLESIKLSLGSNLPVEGGITYRTHVQTYGWESSWKSDGAESGTHGESKRLEAIQIKLTGELAEAYHVYYRVHAQNLGWMGWAKDGEEAGTSGLAWRLEGIQVVLVPNGEDAPTELKGIKSTFSDAFSTLPSVTYKTHVQTYGWQDWVSDGASAGTTGEGKRLEGLMLKIAADRYSVRYRTHVQTYGWQDWVENGATSGTSGESKRLEAFQIELTGNAASYFDIWYRCHVQTYGWLGWAKNGAMAGTAGGSRRMESIEIKLLPKGASAPGCEANTFLTISGTANSPYVCYTQLSPNHSGQRYHSIDTITPHYMGGDGSLEGLGLVFAPVSRQASSNYGISSDGRIGLYCEECNRSWCSSSAANDNRAITIECANRPDSSLSPYAWDSLVKLCADICRRNGLTRLVYRGSADYSGLSSTDCLLTMHKWFAPTACPGEWLSARFGQLADEVNAQL